MTVVDMSIPIAYRLKSYFVKLEIVNIDRVIIQCFTSLSLHQCQHSKTRFIYAVLGRTYLTQYPVIEHVYNIPTMQYFNGTSRNTQSKSYMLSLTECVWEFRNNALWDTDSHALL